MVEHGSVGLLDAHHDGARLCFNRCNTGWLITMPWESMGSRSIVDVQAAWTSGAFPSSLHIELYGPWTTVCKNPFPHFIQPAIHPQAVESFFDGSHVNKANVPASDIAYEVRRGWAEPYGDAMLNRRPMDWKQGRLDNLSRTIGFVKRLRWLGSRSRFRNGGIRLAHCW